MSYVSVRSATADDRVVLWERDPRHPDGEVFIAGDGLVQAGLTEAVTTRIRNGLLDVSGVLDVVEEEQAEQAEPVEEEPVLPAKRPKAQRQPKIGGTK